MEYFAEPSDRFRMTKRRGSFRPIFVQESIPYSDARLDQYTRSFDGCNNIIHGIWATTTDVPAVTTSGPGSMDLDSVKVKHITAEEKQRRREKNLCLYCGGSNHFAGDCPVKKSPSRCRHTGFGKRIGLVSPEDTVPNGTLMKKGHVESGRANVLFTVIDMANYWCAVRFDVKNHCISCGDSLGYKAPLDTIREIVERLAPLTGGLEAWDLGEGVIGEFQVPQLECSAGSKDFLFLLAHRTQFTNGRLAKAQTADAACTTPPDDEPAYESHNHAFYGCPSVLALWTQTLVWILQMLPQLQLSAEPNQLLLGWPAVKQLPPRVIHLHSVVTHEIYRIFCKLGDGEKLFPEQLMWMAISGLQSTDRTELEREQNSATRSKRNKQLLRPIKIDPLLRSTISGILCPHGISLGSIPAHFSGDIHQTDSECNCIPQSEKTEPSLAKRLLSWTMSPKRVAKPKAKDNLPETQPGTLHSGEASNTGLNSESMGLTSATPITSTAPEDPAQYGTLDNTETAVATTDSKCAVYF
ncbi:hypothetical protein EC968_001081 [Mortierella alpina]|nr:hypothetical protein EC968_001081 [Mortierella alpina]